MSLESNAAATNSSLSPSEFEDRSAFRNECRACPPELIRNSPDQQTGENRNRLELHQRPSSWWERSLLRKLLGFLEGFPVNVLLWDGWASHPELKESDATIRIHDRRSLWKLLYYPDYHFFNGYAQGKIEVDGDLTKCIRLLHQASRAHGGRPSWRSTIARYLQAGRSQKASRGHIAHHYDIGNDFYRLWLDEQLLYTCAYFETEDLSLERAQIAKMDHVCRKLRLQPGETVIEAGCGWGALALHMARQYGVRVQAYNISREQLQYARKRAEALGVSDQVQFIENDWRHITGKCDAFVSVGMLEHVGPENFPLLGQIIQHSLSPGGRGLIHSIGQNVPEPLNPWIERRIFPGAQPPTLKQMMELCEPNGLAVHDVENMRPHYAATLRHWLQRFESSLEQIRSMFDEFFVRMWRMSLAASIAAFEAGELELFQVVFAPTETDPARNRADLYRHLFMLNGSHRPQ